jgi:AcrR family transcriptional regulator
MNGVQRFSGEAARKRTADRHAALRDALLDAAERAVEREGLAGLRARALADAAGCALGAIYTVFPDLDALILAVNGRTLDAIDRALHDPARTGSPTKVLTELADCYLAFVAAHPLRCAALFNHAVATDRPIPDWYQDRQTALFAHVEAPLRELRPDFSADARGMLARTLFSAVHGIVSLGLDQKLAPIAEATLREQLRLIVAAIVAGLATSDDR